MAIDSERDRRAAAGVPFGIAPNILPDGTLDEGDRRTVAGDFTFGASEIGGEEGGGEAAGILITGSDYRMGRHNGRRSVLINSLISVSGS